MSQTCTVCRHPELNEIHDAIIREVPYRNIGKKFNIGWQSVRRHKLECMPKLLELADVEKKLAGAENVTHLVSKWYRELVNIYEQAKEKEDVRLILYVMDRIFKCIELINQKIPGNEIAGLTVVIEDMRKPWEKNAQS